MILKNVPKQIDQTYTRMLLIVSNLHKLWTSYKQLFYTSKQRTQLLDKSAKRFFKMVEGILINEIVLIICKLADPSCSKGKQRFSLEALKKEIQEVKRSSLNKELKQRFSLFKDKTILLKKDFRNKTIAHYDYSLISTWPSKPLPKIAISTIEDILRELRNFMNSIEYHFNKTKVLYEEVVITNGVDVLMDRLKMAFFCEELINSKKINRADFEKFKYYTA